MAGIYGAFLNHKNAECFHQSFSENPVANQQTFQNGAIGRAVLNKLEND